MGENEEQHYCYICNDITEEYLVCDICEQHYCDDCSYTYSLHYQFQGGRCYECSGQSRVKPLEKNKVRDNTIEIILKDG